MDKIIEYVDKFNFKAYLVNLGITALYTIFGLFDLMGFISKMPMGLFLKTFALLAATLIAGVVVLTTIHMVLWCACDYYKKNSGMAAADPAPAPVAAPEAKKEEDKKEEK